MGRKDLKPISPGKQAREYGRKGGLASVEARRAKKTFKSLAQALLDLKPQHELVEQLHEEFPDLDKKQINVRAGMLLSLMKRALKGDLAAYEAIVETAGEKQPEQIHMTQSKDKATIAEELKVGREILDRIK